MSSSFVTIIMAAGKGTRMKSDLPKVLHQLAGKPLVHHVIDLANSVGSERTLLIISHEKEMVIEATRDKNVEWVVQEKPRGTGDAVKSCADAMKGFNGDVLILSGDVPLLNGKTIQEAYKLHKSTESVATVFTFEPDDATGYGRILRGDNGELLGIVEQKDATEEQLKVGEVNSGIYFYQSVPLFKALEQVTNDNASGEYYLPDTIHILAADGRRMSAYLVEDQNETAGVNSKEQLAELEEQLKDS